MRLLVKALVVFWPFFRTIIFKDRPVKEVLRANRQFTLLFSILLVVTVTLVLVTGTLNDTKSELLRTTARMVELEAQIASFQTRASEAAEIVQAPNGSLSCEISPYDKQRVINLLDP